jgi:hypothetical protein
MAAVLVSGSGKRRSGRDGDDTPRVFTGQAWVVDD